MDQKNISFLSRRQFIRQAACAAVGTTALSSTIRDLRFMNAAMAQSNVTDYKALVCIFLAGGNDSNNLIIPTIQSEWDTYASIRTPVLAIPLTGTLNNTVIPITSANPDGHGYGFHPACPQLASLFQNHRLAVLFNTGTLAYPMTRTEYNSFPQKRPPQLFSHADQVTQWQTSIPDQPALTGWGGRCADLMAAVQPNAPVSLLITLAGANTFEVGNITSQYSVSTSGAISLSGLVPGARSNALVSLLGQSYPNLQVQAYGGVAAHAINTGALLNGAIQGTASTVWTQPFPGTITVPTGNGLTTFNSSLGPQLKMVARLIEAGSRSVASQGFGMKRQIFFCQIGGYDLHTGQTDVGSPTTGAHAKLLAEISQCLNAFQSAMDQIGAMHNDSSFANRVTAFTSSDFGRTFPSNGQGSDHGWGSHHLIMGGAVNGGRTYGKFPTLAIKGPDDTDTGRWIPSTSCDQYFATLATWFGLDNNNLSTVFPNLGRFSTSNLGFI